MEPIKNDYELNQFVEALAADGLREHDFDFDFMSVSDAAHFLTDGCEHVAYYHKAHSICQNCNISLGEQFLREIEFDLSDMGNCYDEIAVIIAYGEICTRLTSVIYKTLESKEAAS